MSLHVRKNTKACVSSCGDSLALLASWLGTLLYLFSSADTSTQALTLQVAMYVGQSSAQVARTDGDKRKQRSVLYCIASENDTLF